MCRRSSGESGFMTYCKIELSKSVLKGSSLEVEVFAFNVRAHRRSVLVAELCEQLHAWFFDVLWWTLEIEEMGLPLASAVDGVRPNGVKTQKKKARTDGDLPLGADTEVPESVVPCGSGGEVGIAIVAPPLFPAHDEGVVTLGPHGHGVSIEYQRRILAIRGGSQHRTEYCGGHVTYYPKKDGKPRGRFDATCGQTWKHGIRCRLTRTTGSPVRSAHQMLARVTSAMGTWP